MTKSEAMALIEAGLARETFTSSDIPFVVDVSSLREAVSANPDKWTQTNIFLSKEVIDFLYEKREIDEARVEQLNIDHYKLPGFVTPLSEERGGGMCPIDGHHRMVKFYKMGITMYPVYVVPMSELPAVKEGAIELQWGERQVDAVNNKWKD
jgi:hypothetical protein